MKRISRRAFVRAAAALGASSVLSACGTDTSPPEQTPAATAPPASPTLATQPDSSQQPTAVATIPSQPTPVPPESAYLSVARGDDPALLTERALAAIGGIERFVRQGHRVIIKPNICNANRTYEYASTTNPTVVATLVRLCVAAGARSVLVMDSPFSGTPEAAYARSGIEEAVAAAGGQMQSMAPMEFVETDIPDGRDLTRWPVYQPVLDADLVINVPIAKHHSLARLTLAGKNLMGVIQNRSQLHRNLGQRIADITSVVRPQLTVVDAVRILMRNGPTGGNLEDVKAANTVIASHDIVAADTYACSLFDVAPSQVDYIVTAAEMGLGTTDLTQVKVEELAI